LQDPEDPEKEEYVRRFNDAIIAMEFKYTYQEIMDLPQYYYDDLLLILAKKRARENQKQIQKK
jgi:hypothetical protein